MRNPAGDQHWPEKRMSCRVTLQLHMLLGQPSLAAAEVHCSLWMQPRVVSTLSRLLERFVHTEAAERDPMVRGLHSSCYSRSNSTKSPASGAGNVSEPSLMSQVKIVHVDQCVSAVWAVEMPVLVCLRSSCNHVTEIRGS